MTGKFQLPKGPHLSTAMTKAEYDAQVEALGHPIDWAPQHRRSSHDAPTGHPAPRASIFDGLEKRSNPVPVTARIR